MSYENKKIKGGIFQIRETPFPIVFFYPFFLFAG